MKVGLNHEMALIKDSKLGTMSAWLDTLRKLEMLHMEFVTNQYSSLLFHREEVKFCKHFTLIQNRNAANVIVKQFFFIIIINSSGFTSNSCSSIIIPWEFFEPALADSLSLES